MTGFIHIAASVKACVPHQIQVQSPRWIDMLFHSSFESHGFIFLALFNPQKDNCLQGVVDHKPQPVNFQSPQDQHFT